MNRSVTVYQTAPQGYGCFKHTLEVTDQNFLAETEHTITVKESYIDLWDCEREGDMTYAKDIDTFIANENEWFSKHLAEIRERHEHTIKMAEALK